MGSATPTAAPTAARAGTRAHRWRRCSAAVADDASGGCTVGRMRHDRPRASRRGAERRVDGDDLAPADVGDGPRLGGVVALDGHGDVDVDDRSRPRRRTGTARSPTRSGVRWCPRSPRSQPRGRIRRTGTDARWQFPDRPVGTIGADCGWAGVRATSERPCPPRLGDVDTATDSRPMQERSERRRRHHGSQRAAPEPPPRPRGARGRGTIAGPHRWRRHRRRRPSITIR